MPPRNNNSRKAAQDEDGREKKRQKLSAGGDRSDGSSTASSADVATVEKQVSKPEDGRDHSQDMGDTNTAEDQTDLLITVATRDYFESELAERLNKLAGYKNEATRCYSLTKLPIAQLEFGKDGQGRNDQSEYLCIRDKPVTIWIVGELLVPLFKQNGLPRRKASVLVRPLVEEDMKRGLGLVERLSKPVVGPSETRQDGLWLSKWMASRAVSDEDVPLFHEVYDALDVLKAKRFMRRMACTQVKAGDIVVAETLLVRWQGSDKDKPPVEGTSDKQERYKRRTWESWRVEFRLEALWYVYPGSDYYTAGAGPGEDVEM